MKNHFSYLDCGVSLAKDSQTTCREQKHKMTDFGEDMEEFNNWLVEWETDVHRGIGKVDHG